MSNPSASSSSVAAVPRPSPSSTNNEADDRSYLPIDFSPISSSSPSSLRRGLFVNGATVEQKGNNGAGGAGNNNEGQDNANNALGAVSSSRSGGAGGVDPFLINNKLDALVNSNNALADNINKLIAIFGSSNNQESSRPTAPSSAVQASSRAKGRTTTSSGARSASESRRKTNSSNNYLKNKLERISAYKNRLTELKKSVGSVIVPIRGAYKLAKALRAGAGKSRETRPVAGELLKFINNISSVIYISEDLINDLSLSYDDAKVIGATIKENKKLENNDDVITECLDKFDEIIKTFPLAFFKLKYDEIINSFHSYAAVLFASPIPDGYRTELAKAIGAVPTIGGVKVPGVPVSSGKNEAKVDDDGEELFRPTPLNQSIHEAQFNDYDRAREENKQRHSAKNADVEIVSFDGEEGEDGDDLGLSDGDPSLSSDEVPQETGEESKSGSSSLVNNIYSVLSDEQKSVPNNNTTSNNKRIPIIPRASSAKVTNGGGGPSDPSGSSSSDSDYDSDALLRDVSRRKLKKSAAKEKRKRLKAERDLKLMVSKNASDIKNDRKYYDAIKNSSSTKASIGEYMKKLKPSEGKIYSEVKEKQMDIYDSFLDFDHRVERLIKLAESNGDTVVVPDDLKIYLFEDWLESDALRSAWLARGVGPQTFDGKKAKFIEIFGLKLSEVDYDYRACKWDGQEGIRAFHARLTVVEERYCRYNKIQMSQAFLCNSFIEHLGENALRDKVQNYSQTQQNSGVAVTRVELVRQADTEQDAYLKSVNARRAKFNKQKQERERIAAIQKQAALQAISKTDSYGARGDKGKRADKEQNSGAADALKPWQLYQMKNGCRFCNQKGHFMDVSSCPSLRDAQTATLNKGASATSINNNNIVSASSSSTAPSSANKGKGALEAIAGPFSSIINLNVAAATTLNFGLVHGLSYGNYKIDSHNNDAVLNDSGCSCDGVISLAYFKLLKLSNPGLELVPSPLSLGSAISGPNGELLIEGQSIIPVFDLNNNKIDDVVFQVIKNLRHHCIIGNPILSKGALSAYKGNRATLRFPSPSNATIKVRIYRDKSLNDNGLSTNSVHLVSDVTVPAGQVIYVPAKSSVYHGLKSSPSVYADGTEIDFIPMISPSNARRTPYSL